MIKQRTGVFMGNLKFRCLIDSYLCDIVPFESYTEKGTVASGLILIVFDANEFDTLITDWDCAEEQIIALEDTGIKVIVAEEVK